MSASSVFHTVRRPMESRPPYPLGRGCQWHSGRMQPPAWAGTVATPPSAPDTFDVPAFLRRSSPLAPAPRPTPVLVASAHQPWPQGTGIPADGAYPVGTTWRELLDATIAVGRDIRSWSTATPRLARHEIRARRYPLSACLVRGRWGAGRTRPTRADGPDTERRPGRRPPPSAEAAGGPGQLIPAALVRRAPRTGRRRGGNGSPPRGARYLPPPPWPPPRLRVVFSWV